MIPRIKICGVTTSPDEVYVAAAGVDFIGLNCWPRSRRYVDPARARRLAGNVRAAGRASLVGVFVDASADEISRTVELANLDIIQLHGDESPALVDDVRRACGRPIWRAWSIASLADLDALARWQLAARADALLLDAPAAATRHAQGDPTRVRIDLALVAEARARLPDAPIVLAGGLDAGNVAAAIAACQPWCVDVASGVERSPGVKDLEKLAAFVAAVRGA